MLECTLNVMVSLFPLKYFDEMISKIAKTLLNEFNSIFLILLFYYPECLDFGAICPCRKTEGLYMNFDTLVL